MRTWFNSVPPEHLAQEASTGTRFLKDRPDDKKRVPVPAIPGSPHALAKETGCPEGIVARRTAAPLA